MSFVSPPIDCFQISLSLDKNLMRYMQSETTQLFIMNNLLNQCLGTLSFQMMQQNTVDAVGQSPVNSQLESEVCLPDEISANSADNRENASSRKRSRKTHSSSYIPSKLPSISEFQTPKSEAIDDSISNDSLLHPGIKEEVTDCPYTLENDDGSDDIVCVKEEILDCRSAPKPEQSPYETLELPGLFTKVLPRKYDSDSNARLKNNRSSGKPSSQTNNNHELDLRPIGGFDSSLRSEFTLGDAVSAPSSGSASVSRLGSGAQSRETSSFSVCASPQSSSTTGILFPTPEELFASQLQPRGEDGQQQQQMFVCPICEQQFSTAGSAKRHATALHGNVRYACQICQKVFNRKDILKHHLQHQHQLAGDVASAMIKCPSSSFKLINSAE